MTSHLTTKRKPFIFNTSKTTEKGTHWCCCVVVNKKAVIYDPLGRSHKRVNQSIIDDQIQKASLTAYYIDNKAQDDDSHWCGYYVIVVVEHWNKLTGKPTIANYTKVITDLFGTDKKPTLEDELVVLEKYVVDGEGIGDWFNAIRSRVQHIKERIQGVVKSITGTRDNFKPSMRAHLEKDGDTPITGISIARTVLGRTFTKVLGMIQKLGNHIPNVPHDYLFHVFAIIKLSNGSSYIIEKNQDLNMVKYSPRPNQEVVALSSVPSGLTMNKMLETTINKVGKERVFHYSAFSNNCQRFLMDLLESNNVSLSQSEKSFILQDVSDLVPSWGKKLAQILTDTKNRLDMATEGYGLSKKQTDVIENIDSAIGAVIPAYHQATTIPYLIATKDPKKTFNRTINAYIKGLDFTKRLIGK
jgi:hypothetical protein